MKEDRLRQIEELLAKKKSISMQELCDYLNVSMNTVRADVNNLVKSGILEKVYGGVVLKNQEDIPLYENRSHQQTDCKSRIAQAAERLIDNGDVVYMDSGTTTMRILDYLDPNKHITVVTPSVSVLVRASGMPNLTLMMLPGLYDKRINALLDSSTVEYMSRFCHTKAFLGASSLRTNGDLGVSNWLEYELKKTVISLSQANYLLVDATKYGRPGLLSYGNVSQLTGIITDVTMPADYVTLCKGKGVSIQQV